MSMTITFDKWHARYLLEALRVSETQWYTTAKASDDEDLQADYGNDLARLLILQEYLERESIEAFGPTITNFSRESFAPSEESGSHL